ncbi:class I SAM-dependent methyltransferase [Limobrevibacterium gyesilva]|uniref:Class I SAM-dependent methyltransferase n=1 Tax=Limobrevibacterium gyesilva TaxID=2991712 RepID=A0AA41YL43_9PROT|nr:class I SAM-dependent methyltransferase [Limobrevibacterium gyesilva]MCW3475791.1 class I SAM-dependent methyltransferase [Limobrevibacterium gyesilva]
MPLLRLKRRFPVLGRIRRRLRALPVLNGGRHMLVSTCTLFFSYFRLHVAIDTAAVFGPRVLLSRAEPSARVLFGGAAPMQKAACRKLPGGGYDIFVEALVDPARFPGDGVLELTLGSRMVQTPVTELLRLAAAEHMHSLFPAFKQHIAGWIAVHGSARPTLLDIGGRARSQVQRSEHYPECDVTTFDIVPAPGVDVVGDAHALSRHFPPERFDFAQSISVFEHLAMPWKVAVEMNRVLKPGGMALIFSHQTIGMHDVPWDFFRFSDESWNGLFNRRTGFEIVRTDLSSLMHIIPRAWSEHYRQAENTGGYEASAVIVRKIGAATVDWDVQVPEILQTAYPRTTAGPGG